MITHNKMPRKTIAILICLLVLAMFVFRVKIKDSVRNFLKPDLPQAIEAVFFSDAVGTTAVIPTVVQQIDEVGSSQRNEAARRRDLGSLPVSINLAVPFVSQAPFGDWGMPYQEACEEASVIMAAFFFENKMLTSQIMDDELKKLVAWEMETFGYYQDTTVREIARILREYFGLQNIEVRYEFTIEDIKRAVAQGYPVIVPAAGRLLPNPYFRQPGPVYHNLVIKGYTQTRIITNDPGTRHGKDFLYTPDSLMNAIHDWDAENILNGVKAMIIVRP